MNGSIVVGCMFGMIAAYYLFQDLSCERPQESIGTASACFFIAAILCLKF